MSIQLKSHADPQRWICIYPLYINSKKTIVQGRRVVHSKAVENPTSQEIYNVIEHSGLPFIIKRNKMHPLDQNRDLNIQGRVRIQIKKEDGSLINEKFFKRKEIMLYVCEMIPKLKTRQPAFIAAHAPQSNASSGKQKKKK